MARSGVSPEQVREVITALEAEGRDVSVIAVRERLGSGSYSTIGAVVQEWRKEREQSARPAPPAPPERLRSRERLPGEFRPMALCSGAHVQPIIGRDRRDRRTY